jgi:prevent-host-death family protein
MLEFRKNARSILRRAQQGQRMVLTYRGKPVARLEPIRSDRVCEDDPFYGLQGLADAGGKPLTNEEMDRAVYET